MKKFLLVIGDAAEVLDTFYPLFRLKEEGWQVDVAGMPVPCCMPCLRLGGST